MPALIALAITGAGVVTGLLFAFSNFGLRSLADLPDEQGMFAMQRLNERIINPIFLLFFLGTPVLCAIVGLTGVFAADCPGRLWLIAGAGAYLVGPFGITVVRNVPLNNALAKVPPGEAAEAWPRYRRRWQFWNHIRSYIGIVSVFLLSLGLAGLD